MDISITFYPLDCLILTACGNGYNLRALSNAQETGLMDNGNGLK